MAGKRGSYARLNVEALEGRELPSASPLTPPTKPEQGVQAAPLEVTRVTPTLLNGTLTVRGTRSDDLIVVSRSGNYLVVANRGFRLTAVSRVVVAGDAGNDTIAVSPAIYTPTILYGGLGNDVIYGGSGNDSLFGAHGTDRLYGRVGNDLVVGGQGNDVADGGAGRNALYQGDYARTDTVSAIEAEIIRLTNLERTRRGLRALTTDAQLLKAADLHASNMAALSRTIGARAAHGHALDGVPQPTLTTRLDYAGYTYRTARENIAFGYTSAAAVVQAWMNSAGHRANILAADVTQIGVAVRAGANGALFFCQNFGARF
jgi:uncharacterized protein YkwD